MIAASRRAFGTVAKKLRIISVQIGMPSAEWTMMTGQSVSISPSVLNSRKSGTRITCGGKNMPATIDEEQRVRAPERQLGEDIAGKGTQRDRDERWRAP
jgi:hypothetical protein